MDKMLEALRTLKEECHNTSCGMCVAKPVCDAQFSDDPRNWDIPEPPKEAKEVEEEDEEISISVNKEKLEQLLDFIDHLTWRSTDGCCECPVKPCLSANTCAFQLLEWLQDHPILP